MNIVQAIVINIVSERLGALLQLCLTHALPLVQVHVMHWFEPLLLAFRPSIW